MAAGPVKQPIANPTYTPLHKQAHYPTFASFYPFYLGEHSRPATRRLHVVGTSVSALCLTRVFVSFVSAATRLLAFSLPHGSPGVSISMSSPPSSVGLSASTSAYGRFVEGLRDVTSRVDRSVGLSGNWERAAAWVLGGVAQGYLFAWVGHFFVEKNRPATFTNPLYSFMGDLKMAGEVWSGRRKF